MDSKPKSMQYGRRLVFSGQEEFGPVEVLENTEFRSLHFGTSARQSEMLLEDPYILSLEYTRLMTMALLFCPNPSSILMLGLGGGSVPKFIWKYFPKCHLDLIDRSPLVAELCHRYFFLPEDTRLSVHLEDAFEFIKRTPSRYDIIFVDLFHGEGISSLAAEPDFFKTCKTLLKNKRSVLVWATWRQTPLELMTKCMHRLCENFGKHLFILPDKEERDYVILAFADSNRKDQLYKIVLNSQKLHKKTGLDFTKMVSDLNFLKDYGLED